MDNLASQIRANRATWRAKFPKEYAVYEEQLKTQDEETMLKQLTMLPGFDLSKCKRPSGRELAALHELVFIQKQPGVTLHLQRGVFQVFQVVNAIPSLTLTSDDNAWASLWQKSPWARFGGGAQAGCMLAGIRYAGFEDLRVAAQFFYDGLRGSLGDRVSIGDDTMSRIMLAIASRDFREAGNLHDVVFVPAGEADDDQGVPLDREKVGALAERYSDMVDEAKRLNDKTEGILWVEFQRLCSRHNHMNALSEPIDKQWLCRRLGASEGTFDSNDGVEFLEKLVNYARTHQNSDPTGDLPAIKPDSSEEDDMMELFMSATGSHET